MQITRRDALRGATAAAVCNMFALRISGALGGTAPRRAVEFRAPPMCMRLLKGQQTLPRPLVSTNQARPFVQVGQRPRAQ